MVAGADLGGQLDKAQFQERGDSLLACGWERGSEVLIEPTCTSKGHTTFSCWVSLGEAAV